MLLGLFQLLGPIGPVEEGDEQQGEDGVKDQQDGECPYHLAAQLVEIKVAQHPVDLEEPVGQQAQKAAEPGTDVPHHEQGG